VKRQHRILAKYFAKYADSNNLKKGSAHKVVDILRCTFGFGNVESVYKAVVETVEFFRRKNKVTLDKNPETMSISLSGPDCVFMKDRFFKPALANGYRDINLTVKIPGTSLWG